MTAEAQKARDAAMSVEAKKDGLSQLQSGEWVLKLKLHANDIPLQLLQAAMGTRYMLAVVEIGDDEMPIDRKLHTLPSDRQSRQNDVTPINHTLSRQSAMCCNEPRFWKFLYEECNYCDDIYSKEDAAEALRIALKVQSRAEIDTSSLVASKWRALHGQYLAWLQI